jgi:hypothetical protein
MVERSLGEAAVAGGRRLVNLPQVLCGRLAVAPVGHELELDLLPFAQDTEPGALDCADMDKGVLAAVVRLDETKTLLTC